MERLGLVRTGDKGLFWSTYKSRNPSGLGTSAIVSMSLLTGPWSTYYHPRHIDRGLRDFFAQVRAAIDSKKTVECVDYA